jgi:hypothetical protein
VFGNCVQLVQQIHAGEASKLDDLQGYVANLDRVTRDLILLSLQNLGVPNNVAS